jgi:adenylate cyclase
MAYAPVVEWLRSEGLQPALAKLEPVWLTEIARLLPELLSEHPDLPRPEPLTEGEQRQRRYLLLLLCQAQTLDGEATAALSTLREALEHTERTGQRYLEAELQRMRAELLLAGADDAIDAASEADAALCNALDVSRRQGARLLELRAATSLARWRTATGSPEQAAEARGILEQVLEAFPDAFATADLDQARELLRLST